MTRRFAALVVFAFVSLGVACSSGDDGEAFTSCDFVTFVRLDGVRYLWSTTNDGIGNVDTGPEYGEVRRDLRRDLDDCRHYDQADGDSAGLRRGTRLYEVEGYSPRFLLATNVEGEGHLWEADLVPDVEYGRDVLDIAGKVRSIRIVDPAGDGTTVVAEITDAESVGAFVTAVMESPVASASQPPKGTEGYFLSFVLEDGVVIRRPYYADTGELSSSGVITLPESARAIIEGAIP
jgi:hypothetical protein